MSCSCPVRRLADGILAGMTYPAAAGNVTLPAAMTSELGTPRVPEMVNNQGTTDPYETTRELVWPANLAVFERMRRSDSQILAQLRSLKMPAQSVDWKVGRGGRVRPEVSATVEAELGLARDEDGRRRALPGGVCWDDLLAHALLMLDFGYSYQEVWWQPGRSEIEGLAGRPAYHLRSSPRLPRSVWKVDVGDHGELVGIWQLVTNVTNVWAQRPIPRSSLAPFVFNREGADWTGRSVLRSCYKNWMIKDGLLRIGALAADRQGMGVPVVTYPSNDGDIDGAKERQALRIASQVRAGADTGVGLPAGWTLEIVGVTGGIIDVLPQVKYHDGAIAKSALAMFMELGSSDTGNRALGQTFWMVFKQAQQTLLRYMEEMFTEEYSRRIVEANFGPDEPYPAITCGELADDLAADALATLVGAGAFGDLNDGIADWVRRRYGAPERTVEAPPPGTPPQLQPGILYDPATGQPVPTPPGPVPTYAPAQPPIAGRPVPPGPNRSPLAMPPARTFTAGHDPMSVESLTARLERAVATLAALQARQLQPV